MTTSKITGTDLFGNPIYEEEDFGEDVKRKKVGLFDGFLPDIFSKKENILRKDSDSLKDYQPFIINKALSMYYDTCMYANEMNKAPLLPKQAQYDFYIKAIRKGSRRGWQKKNKVENLELVMNYYKINEQKATTALSILTEKDIEEIMKDIEKGGRK